MTQGTKTFGKQGDESKAEVVKLPPAPEVDYSWHPYASCDGDEAAAEAVEKIQQEGRRPWEKWCYDCPVAAHCLLQGLKEDALAPAITSGKGGTTKKYAPFVYGGFTPRERRVMDEDQKEWHAARLREEDEWLRDQEQLDQAA